MRKMLIVAIPVNVDDDYILATNQELQEAFNSGDLELEVDVIHDVIAVFDQGDMADADSTGNA